MPLLHERLQNAAIAERRARGNAASASREIIGVSQPGLVSDAVKFELCVLSDRDARADHELDQTEVELVEFVLARIDA